MTNIAKAVADNGKVRLGAFAPVLAPVKDSGKVTLGSVLNPVPKG